MSHQPSTRDQLHDRAARIYDRAIAPQDQDADQDSENFTRDPLGNVVRKGALKDRLGEATVPERGGEEGILEKGMFAFASTGGAVADDREKYVRISPDSTNHSSRIILSVARRRKGSGRRRRGLRGRRMMFKWRHF